VSWHKTYKSLVIKQSDLNPVDLKKYVLCRETSPIPEEGDYVSRSEKSAQAMAIER